VDTSDLTVQILREIRDELRATKVELGAGIRETNARLDQTNARLEQSNARLDRLDKRQTESEIRLTTELVAVAHAVDSLKELLAQRLDLLKQVNGHELRISALEERLDP